MFERILIAYDESKEAQRALREGLKLASQLNSHVTIATVAEPLPGYYMMASVVAPSLPSDMRQEQLERLGKMQVRASEMAKHLGLSIETMLVESDEISGILEAAKALGADLIVLGLHRHMQNIEWAGTVRKIANNTPCSILAVV